MAVHPSPQPPKTCTRCGEAKATEAYYRRRNRSGVAVLRAECIACHRSRFEGRRATALEVTAISIRKRGGQASVPALRLALGEPASLSCYLCGDLLAEDRSIDHIIPVVRGGTHDASNLGWCHRICNTLKGALTIEEFCSLASRIIAVHGGH